MCTCFELFEYQIGDKVTPYHQDLNLPICVSKSYIRPLSDNDETPTPSKDSLDVLPLYATPYPYTGTIILIDLTSLYVNMTLCGIISIYTITGMLRKC